ncbi:MAG: tRNA (adenosine(37)-N6)-threonylcarbamoyltransferase complex ATPase subunit type 1 TsaE [Candidatus Saccharimonadales bacterium]
MILTTNNSSETESIAEAIGRQLHGGEVIELNSDLGGGKTTFVRGLARGFGSKDRVSSPTFTISKVYKKGKQEMHHFDFYRLQESGLMGYELEDVLDDTDNIVVVEWSGIVEKVLPLERLKVELSVTEETSRKLVLSYPEKLAYLVKNTQSL